jgi:xanthine dehydrogenase accessory factor
VYAPLLNRIDALSLGVIWDFETTSKKISFNSLTKLSYRGWKPLPPSRCGGHVGAASSRDKIEINSSMNLITKVSELLETGETFCLATVITSDSPDIRPGRKMVVRKDGIRHGAIGSPQLDSDIREQALAALGEKKSCIIEIDGGIRVFINVLLAEARLLICGAGHIALPLARFANDVGFSVTVLDDRSDFAHPSRFPGCTTITENFSIALRDMPLGPNTYVVIITRGHEHDVDCLLEILPRQVAYVGLIGSRRRVSFVLQWLEEKGFSRKRLKDVFTPIGTPLGAESPEEIAISIISELICVRRKGKAQARALRAAIGIEL